MHVSHHIIHLLAYTKTNTVATSATLVLQRALGMLLKHTEKNGAQCLLLVALLGIEDYRSRRHFYQEGPAAAD